MKKILLDVYLAENIGDDLFVSIIADHFPTVEFNLVNGSSYAKKTFGKYNNVNGKNRNLMYRVIKRIIGLTKINLDLWFVKLEASIDSKKFDALITLGGSMYIESQYSDFLYNKRYEYQYAFNSNNKPCLVIGSNFGPFKSERFYNDYNRYFKACYDVSFREIYSANLFDLPNIRCNPDVVFGLEYEVKLKKKQIGLSIIDLKCREDLMEFEECYQQNLIKLVEKAYSEDYEIILLSFCEGEGDLSAIKSFLNRIPEKISRDVVVHNYSGDINNSLEVLCELELVVATRFHSMILSQVFGQGVLPYIYSDKTLNVLKDMNFDELYIDIRDNKKENIDEIWKKIKGNKMDITKLKRDSLKQFSGLEQFIKCKN